MTASAINQREFSLLQAGAAVDVSDASSGSPENHSSIHNPVGKYFTPEKAKIVLQVPGAPKKKAKPEEDVDDDGDMHDFDGSTRRASKKRKLVFDQEFCYK